MRLSNIGWWLGPWFLTVLLSARVSAQGYVGGSVTVSVPYLWRGIERASDVNTQAEVYGGFGFAGGYVSSGLWANLELSHQYASELSDLGADAPGLGELDWWAHYSRPFGKLQTTLGLIHYGHRATAVGGGRSRRDNTAELYGIAQIRLHQFYPELAIFYDVDEVVGLYVEASVEAALIANPYPWPKAAALVGVQTAFNWGQEPSAQHPQQQSYFARTGSTHTDLWIAALVRPFRLEGHLTLNRDARTRIVAIAPDRVRPVRFWVELSATALMRSRGRP
jgi:hypothetical protein